MTATQTQEFRRIIGSTRQPLMKEPVTNARRLTVFADGVKGVGARPGDDISDYFLTRGDFFNTRYPRCSKFSSEQARADLVEFCKPYDVIDLVGTSWGGLVMYDCGLSCLRYHPDKLVTLTLADAPFGGRDINDKRGRLIARLPSRLEIPAALNRRLMASGDTLTPSLQMSDADRRALAQHREGLEHLTIGALASRLRAMYNRTEPTRWGITQFHRVNCLYTPDDPLIDPNAARQWKLWVNEQQFRHIDVTGACGHAAMFEYQQEWLKAFEACFEH